MEAVQQCQGARCSPALPCRQARGGLAARQSARPISDSRLVQYAPNVDAQALGGRDALQRRRWRGRRALRQRRRGAALRRRRAKRERRRCADRLLTLALLSRYRTVCLARLARVHNGARSDMRRAATARLLRRHFHWGKAAAS